MNTQSFLIEIGTEELPPKSLTKLSDSLVHSVTQGLITLGLTCGKITAYAAPRRLALHIKDLAPKQADKHIEKRGPSLHAALDASGAPTQACEGFLRSCQADVKHMEQHDGYVWVTVHERGKTVTELLPT